MQVHKYGIVLRSLVAKDLELVRQWRNSEKVRPYMQYQNIITEAEQFSWFNSMSIKNNFYFIIEYQSKKLGLIHIKQVDWESRTGEAGIFLGSSIFENTLQPILATLSLMDFAFGFLKLQQLKAKILRSNIKVINFNLSLGYTLCERSSHNLFDYYRVDFEQYKAAIQKWRGTLGKLDKHYELIMTKEEKLMMKELSLL